MTYEEWLSLIKRLEKSTNKIDVEKFKNEPVNNNLRELLIPKIKTMILNRLYNNINSLIESLEAAFETEDELDLYMVNFKKSITQTYELINCQQLLDPDRMELSIKIRQEVDKTYEIMENEANMDSDDGVLTSIIRRNRIKWSGYNELSRS